MSRLERLRRMSRDELITRGRIAARTCAERVVCAVRRPRWNRKALRHVLNDATLTPSMRAAISAGDWRAAHAELADTLRRRPARFPLDPRSRERIRAAVASEWPNSTEEAAAAASRLLAGEYDLLGYRGLRFAPASGEAIDWHVDPVSDRRAPRRFWADVPYLDPACGDHKVIWELNRHQHWLTLGRAWWLTGDERYAAAIVTELRGWLAANPPLIGTNWASMLELAFRSLSWIWALHFLLADVDSAPAADAREPWLVDLLVGLDRQLQHVERNLSSYFSPNTHLTGEALSLYVAGCALPELRRAGAWREAGRRVLIQELERQVCADGGHAERSLHYHRYTLDFYVLAAIVADRAGDEAALRFREAAQRLAEFARTMADDDGRLPCIGDDDGGMLCPIVDRDASSIRESLAVAAALLGKPELAPWSPCESTLWLTGQRPAAGDGAPHQVVTLRAPSRLFEPSGYAVIRDDSRGHLILDVGPHGFLNGGHAHADALAVTLTLDGIPLLIDSGTGTYTMDPALRDRMRHTAAHNTVVVDGRSAATPRGPFHWHTRADAAPGAWRSNDRFAWAEASHDAYAPLRHRRSIVHAGGSGWLFVDELLGDGMHQADVNWHFDPRWTVTDAGEGRLVARHLEGARATVVHSGGVLSLGHGDADGRGWCAPTYGPLVATFSARFSHQIAAPDALFTWVERGAGVLPTLRRLRPAHDTSGAAHGVAVTRGRHQTVTILRPGDAAARAGRHLRTTEYATDARMLQYEHVDGTLTALSLADGTYAHPVIDALPAIESTALLSDLHVSISDGLLALHASTPPPRLSVRGAAVSRIRALSLNGRDAVVVRDGRADSIVIYGGAWAAGAAESRTSCVA